MNQRSKTYLRGKNANWSMFYPLRGTLIFSYIRRLGSFLGVQHFEFQCFLGGFQKIKYLFRYENYVDIFGVITKLGYI